MMGGGVVMPLLHAVAAAAPVANTYEARRYRDDMSRHGGERDFFFFLNAFAIRSRRHVRSMLRSIVIFLLRSASSMSPPDTIMPLSSGCAAFGLRGLLQCFEYAALNI